MGQAKKRGSFEQRQQAAYDRIDAVTGELNRQNEELERVEREAEAMMSTNASQLITAYWKHTRMDERLLNRTALDLVIAQQ